MTDMTTHASAAPTTPDSTPVEWHTADADDRWPGRWTTHTASVHAHGRIYLIRITPGDHATYLTPGVLRRHRRRLRAALGDQHPHARRGQAPRSRGRLR